MAFSGLDSVDVTGWAVSQRELRGNRIKYWVVDPHGNLWLRKEPHPEKPFQSVTEVIALGIAKEVGVPAPDCALCTWAEEGIKKTGVIVRSFSTDSFSQGSDVIGGVDQQYNPEDRAGHTLSRVRLALEERAAAHEPRNALLVEFAKIMTLDALLGIQDRHAGNWGLLTEATPRLAPFYDGAACMGSELNESSLEKKRQKIHEYVDRCPSGFGDGFRLLTQKEALRQFLREWTDRVTEARDITKLFRKLFDERMAGDFSEVPKGLLPGARTTFILTLLELRLKFVEGEVENGPSVVRPVA